MTKCFGKFPKVSSTAIIYAGNDNPKINFHPKFILSDRRRRNRNEMEQKIHYFDMIYRSTNLVFFSLQLIDNWYEQIKKNFGKTIQIGEFASVESRKKKHDL